MMQRLLNSRSFRKYWKHKPAVVSSIIIAGYVIVSLAIVFGDLVTIENCEQRVAPKELPGFGLLPVVSEELNAQEEYVNEIDRLLQKQRKNPDTEEKCRYMGLEVVDRPPEQLEKEIEEYFAVADQLYQIDDIDDIVAEGGSEAQDILSKLTKARELQRGFYTAESQDALARKLQLSLGTDRQGRSIFLRAVYSIKVAITVGFVTGILAVGIGTILGLIAGYSGGWADALVTWLYSTFASIPNIVLLMVLAWVFQGGEVDKWLNDLTNNYFEKLIGGALEETLIPVIIAFSATYWIGPCRIIRGETLKLRESEYVQAARVMGFSRFRVLFRHILPNLSHLMLINFSLLFIGAIKSEVILSFLGLGVQRGASWGKMIDASKSDVANGMFWQIGAATAFMFALVLAFNILSDALQDILDPKHV